MTQPTDDAMTARRTHLASGIAPHIRHDGFNTTPLEGFTLIASACRRPREPLIYEPGLVFVVQGEKIGYIDDRVIHYGAGHYLVQAMPLPFECETQVDAAAPLLGAALRIAPDVLSELVAEMPSDVIKPGDAAVDQTLPMAAVDLDERMADALARLIDCLNDDLSARLLGASRAREVVFEALRGPQGHLLQRLLQEQGAYARIGQAISQLHADYATPLSVADLAARAHMSASSFHAHFKRLTRMSPLQYQKRIRLLRARDLLARHAENVGGAARAVGYQSASQFSREYKRYFGVAPAREREALTTARVG